MRSDPGQIAGRNGEPDGPLEIPVRIHEAMVQHCRRESPLECCGVLGGIGARALSFHPLRNLAASETRFEADPLALVQAWRWLREHGQEIVAIYHSHPRWQAVPSAVDRARNHWGDMPQIIVSLLEDPAEVRAWRLEEQTQHELAWILTPEPGPDDEALRPAPGPD